MPVDPRVLAAVLQRAQLAQSPSAPGTPMPSPSSPGMGAAPLQPAMQPQMAMPMPAPVQQMPIHHALHHMAHKR